MKKINLFLVTVVLLLSVAGCSNSNYFIGEDSVGDVTFSSTISQLKKIFKNVKIEERYSGDFGEYIWVELSNGSEREIGLIVYYDNDIRKNNCFIDQIIVPIYLHTQRGWHISEAWGKYLYSVWMYEYMTSLPL